MTKKHFTYLGWTVRGDVSYFAKKGNRTIYVAKGSLDDLLFLIEKEQGREGRN